VEPAAGDTDARAGAAERRLARLGYDLHDGPLQEIAVLAADLRLLRTQVGAAPAEIVRGRIDDALGLLAEIETDVRDLARSLESTKLLTRPLAALVQGEADQAEADGIAVTVRIAGDVDACTPSQRIALFRIVQESLWNIRHHSGATVASVGVTAAPELLSVEITDTGRGFDVERAVQAGTATGRLGLAGMQERVRLLGGVLDLVSGKGGPTTVRATIPRWRPSGDAGQAAARPRLSA
jgi:signal transduction histidine kinase